MSRWIGYACQTLLLIAFALTLYILSYAPFLKIADPNDRVTGIYYYRAPVIYRLAEWSIVKTPAQAPLLKWAELWDVRYVTDLQAFYYAQNVDIPGEDF